MSGIAAKYTGRPIETLASLHQISMPSLDLGVVGYGIQHVEPSTNVITSDQSLADFSMPTGSGLEKNLIRELAINDVEEVTNMAQDVLSLEC